MRGAARTSRADRVPPGAGVRRGTRRRACPSRVGVRGPSGSGTGCRVAPGGAAERSERRRRDGHDPRLAVLRRLLAALTVERVADRDLPARSVEVLASDARELARATPDVAEQQDDCAELGAVLPRAASAASASPRISASLSAVRSLRPLGVSNRSSASCCPPTITAPATTPAYTAAASASWARAAGRSSTSPRCSTPTRPNDVAPGGYNEAERPTGCRSARSRPSRRRPAFAGGTEPALVPNQRAAAATWGARRRAAKSVPNTNRISGPKVAAAE